MGDTSMPAVRSWPWCGGYQAHFRKPGGSWQFVRDEDGKARVYPTSEAAKDAATAMVFRFMCPPIVAHREPTEKTVADALGLASWKAKKVRERVEQRRIHKAGRRKVTVERKRG